MKSLSNVIINKVNCVTTDKSDMYIQCYGLYSFDAITRTTCMDMNRTQN